MAIGTVWEEDSWESSSWVEGSWEDIVVPPPSPITYAPKAVVRRTRMQTVVVLATPRRTKL
jgi:hypothetical protein